MNENMSMRKSPCAPVVTQVTSRALSCLARSRSRKQLFLPIFIFLFLSVAIISIYHYPYLRPISSKSEEKKTLSFARPADTMDAAQLDYELRLQEARMKGRQQPPEQFLRWLHPPKTGTSFVNTMVRWGCPNIPDNTFVVPVADTPTDLGSDFNGTISWDWLFSKESGREWLKENCNRRLVTLDPNTLMPHYSLWAHRALIAWEIPNTVVIFRLPLQRTYSNYLHLAHHFNESKTPRRSLLQFAKLPKYMSQQAKLVLGRTYDDTNIVSALDANRAADIVAHGFKFVGLTEEYELSIRLFHAKFGGVPHDAEFENTRPGIKRYRDTTARSRTFRYNESDFRGWTDTSDDIVYQAARKRFWRDVRALKDEIEVDGLGPVTVKTEHMQ